MTHRTRGAPVTAARVDPLAGLPLLEDLPDVGGRKVLVRTDFNVPLRWPDGPAGPAQVADDFRIRAALPTLDWLTGHGADVTVCTHLGRPHGRHDPRYDMAPVRDRLAQLAPGVELLDNLRFDPGEKANDPAFVDRLVAGFDSYVNDAFGVSHRSHASIVGPPARLPSAAGRLLAREVEVIGGLLARPARPFLAVVGGAKVTDKLGVLRSLLGTVDRLIVGGGMAFTFLAAQGHSVGSSLFDASAVATCRALLDEAGDRVLLPSDVVVRRTTAGGDDQVDVVGPDVPADSTGLDIGPDERPDLRGGGGRRRDRLLERSHGRLRGSPLRRRHLRRGRGHRRELWLHRRRRRRLGRRTRPTGPGRAGGVRLHRWRSLARAARVRRSSGPGGAAPCPQRHRFLYGDGDGTLTWPRVGRGGGRS